MAATSGGAHDAQPAWLSFADALLHREAVLSRIGRDAPPNDFAGLFIGEKELDRLLAEVSGVVTVPAEQLLEINDHFAPHIKQLQTRMAESMADPSTQFDVLAWNANLTGPEAEVFALIAAVELEPTRQRLTAYVQDNVTWTRPTLATLTRLFAAPHPGALAVAADSRLRRSCLVEVANEGPWGARAVSLAPSIAWSLVADGSQDPDLPAGTEFHRFATEPGGVGLLLVVGGNRASRLAAAAEHASGTDFVRAALPSTAAHWAALVREATVKGVSVILECAGDGLLPAEARDWIDRSDHVTWILSSAKEFALESLPRRSWHEVHVDDADANQDEWMTQLGINRDASYRLDQEQLRLVADALPTSGDLASAVRRLAGGHLDQLARRIRPGRTWDNLVLPPDHRAQLSELAARYRLRSKVYDEWEFEAVPSAGLVALFSGPSGTGKTLSAEIIAGELGLDVYKIDLSSVVSKWIGETEKNLERIFTAAEASNLVLFFDEADSVFGKRSEVSDSRDRYANLEVSYLLQRLESYDGLVILATNFKKNIDEAFLRRIHVSIDFAMPEEDERLAIWNISFPEASKPGVIDFEFLAKQFKISGGVIRNAAVQAAFLAASADEPITTDHVMLGLKREFQKLGRLRTKEEFGPYHDLVQGSA